MIYTSETIHTKMFYEQKYISTFLLNSVFLPALIFINYLLMRMYDVSKYGRPFGQLNTFDI